MKKILCMLLIMTSAMMLSSCARLKIVDDDSSMQSTSSSQDTSGSSEKTSSSTAGSNNEDSKDDKSDKVSENNDAASSSGNENKPNINININNNSGGGHKTVEYVQQSTKQYYLQKLYNIEAGMSDLDVYRAGSNADMKYAAGVEYQRWDDVLNEIYSVLKGQLSSGEMSSLEKEELKWIKYKENEAKIAGDQFKGGTAEPLAYTSRLAELTKERCYYLVNNYMR